MMRKVVLVAVVLCVCAQLAMAQGPESDLPETEVAAPAAAATPETSETSDGAMWSEAGYGTLAVLSNVLYMPAKIVYGTLGLVTGSLAYVLTVGDADAANTVWSPSLGGTYIVTPAILRGEEPLLFSGPSHSKK